MGWEDTAFQSPWDTPQCPQSPCSASSSANEGALGARGIRMLPKLGPRRTHRWWLQQRPVIGIYFSQLQALVPSLSSSARCSRVNESSVMR